jgi:large subunit ribosomal protein L10
MPNIVKDAIRKEYDTLLPEGLEALFVQPVGMSVADTHAFRSRLAESRLRMRVLKNSLARQALAERGLEATGFLFEGSAAVIVPMQDAEVDAPAITAAKVVAAWWKDSGTTWPEVKGGVMEGTLLDAAQAAELRKLPGKAELLSILSGQIQATGRRLASQFTAAGGRLAGALKMHVENLQEAG